MCTVVALEREGIILRNKEVLAAFESVNLPPEQKKGFKDIEWYMTEILPHILPKGLDENHPRFAQTLHKNFRTIPLREIKERMLKDLDHFFIPGVRYFHAKSPDKSTAIIDRLNRVRIEFSQGSYTGLEYLIFTTKLVYAAEDRDYKPGFVNGRDLCGVVTDYAKNFVYGHHPGRSDSIGILPFPIFNGDYQTDGIFSEASIVLAMICRIYPIMYHCNPHSKVHGDNNIGPFAGMEHDIHGHFFRFHGCPAWFQEMPKILKNVPLTEVLISNLFFLAHETDLSFCSISLNKMQTELYPLYVGMANYVIEIIRRYTSHKTMAYLTQADFANIVTSINNGPEPKNMFEGNFYAVLDTWAKRCQVTWAGKEVRFVEILFIAGNLETAVISSGLGVDRYFREQGVTPYFKVCS